MKKNIMKLLAFALIVMFSQSLVAQGEGRGSGQGQRQTKEQIEERAKQRKAQLVKDLKLDKDQIKKMNSADKKYQEEMTKMRESGNRENMRAMMTKMNAKRDSVYTTFFNKDQQKKYKEILKTRAANRGGRGRGIR